MDSRLPAEFRFMHKQAGYATPPGHAASALHLARIRLLLDDACDLDVATVEWIADDWPLDYDDTTTRAMLDDGSLVGPFGCVVTVGEATSSLWGIVVIAPSGSGDDPYVRVVEAEIASELEDDLRQAVGDARDTFLLDVMPL